ncbi:Platinum sensitivity protein [Coccidioides posadasii str. Silveira]|uniref:Platinum sensitivity protein n=1 Tax=Coccidioides posadasii (strain RMSCC 757 / Silveira) TaxID=443226 RepID=UPI001BF0C170|nr:Platinum sensitivity protein [Coccidioides posadasii str. Silveira]
MMAPAIPPPNDRKRVKVYELKDNDWFDRGTGFCTGQIFDDEPKILVESEDQPDRMLLETKISRDDGYQKQQETLIVWTEPNGTDMALSFQEAEGCAVIWDFVRHVQQQFMGLGPDDSLSDDALDSLSNPIMLPPPELGNLAEIENAMRASTTTQTGRDAISKFVIRDEYILKLLPLVSVAEDLESLPDLHRLCNIMKSLILLNDNTIIELVVSDHVISGVVGALEYDPEFPTHKANHRQYLNDRSRYKEVVPIKDPIILRKIRHTWRLQYLKDVVLARILDDPTFSVLNSLIFFNQVDIVQHLQANTPFLNELFALFNPRNTDNKRKEDAVQFIHQCALIAKNLQAAARGSLFGSFINHGLFPVIAYAVKHPKPALRTTGVDILVALLDHDPIMMRGYMLKAVNEKKVPLTDTLIELLHTETDLGVKNQLADAIKVLLDPQTPVPEVLSRMGADFLPKLRSQNVFPDTFVQNHFDESAKRLFLPLKRLEARSDLGNLTFQEVALFSHLVDILTFFVRQHLFRSRNLMHAESLAPRIAQLLTVPQKHLKLTALKFFRTLISLQDTFYYSQMTHNNTFELILNIVYETMPRDNLLNSACLELFEYVKRENIKPIIIHVVENYREKIKDITYVDTFQNLMIRYDQMQGYGAQPDATLFSQDESTTPTRNLINGGHRWQGVREMDAAEEEYFDASDDEEDEVGFFSSSEMMRQSMLESRAQLMASCQQGKPAAESSAALNGSASPAAKPLVDYPDDDDDAMDVTEHGQAPTGSEVVSDPQISGQPLSTASSDTLSQISFSGERFLERFSEKRRREEDDDDDELIKLSSASKRRGSSASVSSAGSSTLGGLSMKRGISGQSSTLSPTHSNAGDKSSSTTPAGTGGKKISFNLSMSSATQAVLKTPDQASSHGPQDSQDETMKGNAAENDSGGDSNNGGIGS